MTSTVTGGKYASTTITTVGTNTVTASGAAFVQADFAVQRLVGLWNSAGSTFLGFAYVRSWVSATQLQLETPFFDPATGATITQAVGQIILVSKNFTDAATTNLSVSDNVVTLNDLLVFGNTTATGVCFFDQNLTINDTTTVSSGTQTALSMLGGLVVFGKLESYANNTVSNPVNVNYGTGFNGLGTGQFAGIISNNALSNFCMYGGQIGGPIGIAAYHGANLGTTGYTYIMNGVQCGFDLTSPNGGGTWGSNQTRMQLVNVFTETSAGNAIMRRWGDGVQSGGSFKFPNNTNSPISALGSDAAGPYLFSAPCGQRAAVLDYGANQSAGASNQPVMWRAYPQVAQTLSAVNFIGTNYYMSYAYNPVVANSQGICNVYFQDTFTFQQPSWANINTTGLTSSASLSVGSLSSINSGLSTIIGNNAFVAGQQIQFSTTVGTSGGQVVAGTTYYVLAAGLSSTSYQVAATSNGTPITFNASGQTTALNSTTATTWSPTLLYETVTGFTTTTSPPTAWYWGVKSYGYQAVSGTITPTTYSLVNATAPNVSFQQTVVQAPDTALTAIGVSQATANAYSTISTLDQLYAACINWATLSQANAAYPNISTYPMT